MIRSLPPRVIHRPPPPLAISEAPVPLYPNEVHVGGLHGYLLSPLHEAKTLGFWSHT
jgi:hypothetical protein